MKDKPVILIVDDTPQSIELLEAYLVPQGYEIVKAANGEEALGKLSVNQIDLILLCVIMPGMDGFEVTRRIRQDNVHRMVPIILVTSLKEPKDRVKGMEAGCDDFISKPVDKVELLARVRSLLKVKDYNDLMSNYQNELESEITRRSKELNQSLENLQTEITERKKAEEELTKLRKAVETSGEAIFLTEPDGTITYVNPEFTRLYGYSAAEVVGKVTPRILKSGTMAPGDYELFWQTLQKGQVVQGELINKTKDGRLLNIEGSANLILDEAGKPIGFLAIQRDITERKKVEVALKESEEKYRLIVENSRDVIFSVNAAGEFTYVSPSVEYALGYNPAALIGHPFQSLIHPDDLPVVHDAMRRNIADGYITPNGIESRFRDASGVWHWSLSRGYTVRNGNGDFLNFTGIAIDINDRKKAEDALRQSEENFRHSLDDLPIGISIMDIKVSKMLYANKALLNLYGFDSIEELRKTPRSQILTKESYTQDHDRREKRQLGEYVPNNYQKSIKRKDGAIRHLQVVRKEILWNGKPELQFIYTDITGQKQAEQDRQLAAKLESVGTLAGGIAHDFNNILTGILGNIQLSKGYLKENRVTVAGEMLDDAEKASFRARDLTQQLLTFSRGGLPVKKVMTVNKLIKETVTFALTGSNVKPEIILPDNLWAAEVDEGQLNQVISNLVINADQAMPNGGIINVSAGNVVNDRQQAMSLPDGNYIEISIKDHGTGIPKEHQDRVFEPYFTTKEKGHGLGLATCYSIIKNHGGVITLDSKLGAGTTFRIYLPATQEKGKEEKEREEMVTKPLPKNQGRILVMDDEDVIRKLLGRMLQGAGYEVEVTGEGAEAIRKYAEAKNAGKPFDAVILDLTVPGGMGGKEVMVKLLEIDPSVKAIVSSGYANDLIMAEHKKYGFSGVVIKPYELNQMQETLRKVLTDK